jgi:lipopolysaccharide/colanic/teichoic acid biosynthesis glycosyltransferase
MLETKQILAVQDEQVFSGPRARPGAGVFAGPARWQIQVKYAADRVMALAGLIILSPVLLACGLIIRTVSPGPALFTQNRVGYEGRLFRIYKFRTMAGQEPDDETDDAARIFWFGSLLRRLSFDELPQLINVLRGEMSLVGPRPHRQGQRLNGVLFEDAVFQYARRHEVMPGMTGWAQINGCRGPAVTQAQLVRRVEHDLFYAAHWSLKLDFVILLRTACFGFIGKSAF